MRAAGAVPATIGIIDGTIRVGLAAAELERFADAGIDARKVGARDIAACVVQGALGATTVGGTLAVCAAAGIRFMSTGGIGGVHRGFADSLDISGDLPQIARTPALVVCSGAKSILDVERHRRAAGDAGHPGARLEHRHAAAVLHRGRRPGGLGRRVQRGRGRRRSPPRTGGWPAAAGCCWPGRPPDGLDIEALIAEAVGEVAGLGVTGQAVTPTILTRVEELSGGRSVQVNQQLIADNAALAAEVAVAYAAWSASGARRPPRDRSVFT